MRKTVPLWICLAVLGGLGAAGCHKAAPPAPKPDPSPDEWQFAVDDSSDPRLAKAANIPAPHLVSPAEGVVLTEDDLKRDQGVVVFSWTLTAVDGHYEFDLATDRNFTSVVYTAPAPRNALAYRVRHPGTYYWRVRVSGAGGAISNVQRFTAE